MKKFFSLLLALLMVAVLLPVTALAADGDPVCENGVWKNVTPTNVQDVLDGKYGSIDNTTIVLGAGDYGQLELGRATAYTGSNTKYTCPHNDGTDNTGSVTFTDVNNYIAHMTGKPHHGDARTFTRTINNVTITAQQGASVNVAGVKLLSREYGNSADPFVTSTEKEYKGYYIDLVVNGLTFSNVNFTDMVEIASQNRENTSIKNVTFEKCTFETNATTQAINFSNNLNNGNAANLVVKDCIFTNCKQGVYTNQIVNVSVTGCVFSEIAHNAIAIQDGSTFDHGDVKIIGNQFTDVRDRIIRFNEVGADTTITIKNNTSVNSGKPNGEIIAASAELPEGVTVTMSGNTWGKVGEKEAINGTGFENVVNEPGTITIIVPSEGDTTPSTTPNPSTGAHDFVSMAAAAAVVALCGAAAVLRKK